MSEKVSLNKVPEKLLDADNDQLNGVEPFGQYLSRERELRAISLEHIADRTRISISSLRALEQDDASKLPARVFALGYIRAYAQAIGLDPDDTILRYEEQSQRESPSQGETIARKSSRKKKIVVLFVGLSVAVAALLFLLHQIN